MFQVRLANLRDNGAIRPLFNFRRGPLNGRPFENCVIGNGSAGLGRSNEIQAFLWVLTGSEDEHTLLFLDYKRTNWFPAILESRGVSSCVKK